MDMKQFFITVARTGRRIEVWRKGEGPDLVFLHGAGGLAAWGPDLEKLSQSFRVTVPFFPGFARSEGIDTIDDVLDAVLHTFDVIKELGLSKPHLVGHSMGGMMAAEMAATCPNDVGRVVLMAPVGLWHDDHPVLDFFTVAPQEISKFVFHDQNHPIARMMSLMPSPDDERIVDLYVTYVKGLSAAGRLLWPVPDRGLKKRIARISAPTLILWGESDGLVPVFYAKEFGRRIPGSRVKIIKEASHMLMLEQPKQVANAIATFLSEAVATRPARSIEEKNGKKETTVRASVSKADVRIKNDGKNRRVPAKPAARKARPEKPKRKLTSARGAARAKTKTTAKRQAVSKKRR